MQLVETMPVDLKRELGAVIEGVTRTVPTAEIILFGSYAYGTPHQDSDIDICVLTFNDDSRSHAWWTKIRSSFRFSLPLDLIVYPKREFEQRAETYPFEKEIRANGMTIYMSQKPKSPMR